MEGRQAVVLPHWVVAGLTGHVLGPLLDAVRQPDGSLDLPDDPALRAALEHLDVLRRRPVLGLLTDTCQTLSAWGPMGVPCTTVEHAAASASGAEKAALIAGDLGYYDRARVAFSVPGWPILVLRTMLLSVGDGRYVLFTGRVTDSFDIYRRAMATFLGISNSQAKRLRPAAEDPGALLGMPSGTVGPVLELPYWKNVTAIFLVRDAFPMEGLCEIPVTDRYGLLVWSHALLTFLQGLGEQAREAGHPPVHLL